MSFFFNYNQDIKYKFTPVIINKIRKELQMETQTFQTEIENFTEHL